MKHRTGHSAITLFAVVVVLVASVAGAQTTPARDRTAEPPRAVRLYVFDCGTLHIADADMGRFRLTRDEVTTTDLSVPCFLVAHPKGTLLWDAGVVPDTAWKPTGAAVEHRLVLPGGTARDLTLRKALTTQLAEAGYSAADVTYLALSHDHYDHTANSNAFPRATWLVRQAERDAMFADPPPAVTLPSTYAALREGRTRIIDGDDHDVSGLKESGAQLWIQHDFTANAKLKKSPRHYD